MYSKVRKLPNDLYAEYVVALNQTTERFTLLADNPIINNEAFQKLSMIKKLVVSLRG
jgi:hypothetical protein